MKHDTHISEYQLPHHESCVVEVPSVSCQTPINRIHDGVLNNVHTARHASREEPLCPARQPIGLHQEASGEKPVVRSYLPVHNVFCEDMGADEHRNTNTCQLVVTFRFHIVSDKFQFHWKQSIYWKYVRVFSWVIFCSKFTADVYENLWTKICQVSNVKSIHNENKTA